MKQTLHTKKRSSGKMLLSLGMVFVLASAITQVHSEVNNICKSRLSGSIVRRM